jgi:hypothetical protein
MTHERAQNGAGVDRAVVDAGLVEAFARDGVVCVRGALDPDEVRVAAGAVESVLAAPGPLA